MFRQPSSAHPNAVALQIDHVIHKINNYIAMIHSRATLFRIAPRSCAAMGCGQLSISAGSEGGSTMPSRVAKTSCAGTLTDGGVLQSRSSGSSSRFAVRICPGQTPRGQYIQATGSGDKLVRTNGTVRGLSVSSMPAQYYLPLHPSYMQTAPCPSSLAMLSLGVAWKPPWQVS